jgi:hypothetical protein
MVPIELVKPKLARAMTADRCSQGGEIQRIAGAHSLGSASARAVMVGDCVAVEPTAAIEDNCVVHRSSALAMVTGLALATVSGCCEPGFTKPREIEFVDAAGTVHRSFDAGQSWTSHPLDTEFEPRGLVQHWNLYTVIYGDDVVRALRGDEWFELPVPDGGWGSLRAAIELGNMLVLSDGESLLLADGNPLQFSWQRIEAPTEVLTFDGGILSDLFIGGRQGRVMKTKAEGLGPNSMWDEIQLDTDADIVAIEYPYVLTDAGELFDLETLTVLDVGDASAGMDYASVNLVIFGASGPLITTEYQICQGK